MLDAEVETASHVVEEPCGGVKLTSSASVALAEGMGVVSCLGLSLCRLDYYGSWVSFIMNRSIRASDQQPFSPQRIGLYQAAVSNSIRQY